MAFDINTMITHLIGKLDYIDNHHIIIDVGGIGYHVNIPTSITGKLPKVGQEIKIHTHQHIREDAHSLYGFLTKEERNLFTTLLSVSGIGPKAGLAFMSSYPLDKLTVAITQSNVDLLSSIPGVGRKTAQKVVIELKEKVAKTFGLLSSDSLRAFGEDNSVLKDTISALITLGYSAGEAKTSALNVLQDDPSNKNIEDIIRKSLKNLS